MDRDETREHEEFPVAALGLDIGSVSLHAAIVDGRGEVKRSFSLPLKGRPRAALSAALERMSPVVGDQAVAVGVTGTGQDLLSSIPGVCFGNEIIATSLAASKLAPSARCLIEVGGHFSKWIPLDDEGEILDCSLNELCAAGSGAFVEQQAARLGLTPAELGALAADAATGATVAGRCSVFAKSDMIHLQQKGTPVAEIAYGVCLALVRNFGATVLKGRDATPPVALIGGAAANRGLVRAFREVLGLGEADLMVAEHYDVFGAVGAALSAASGAREALTMEVLSHQASEATRKRTHTRGVLTRLPACENEASRSEGIPEPDRVEGEVFLGVDVGSVSTDFALIDKNCDVLAGVYLPTRGQPITVMEEGLAKLKDKIGSSAKVLAAATTGSGRHLAEQFLQADVARNEITAQLRSTCHYFPEVDTIFEIGGQDSKYISVKDGSIDDFAMNKICAAGTGSFLEEQAVRLGLNVIGEFEREALKSNSPIDLGSQCTVFMDTEVIHAQRRGAAVEDVAAGLAYAIARNYLEKVVGNRPVGAHVVFQGGVASNRAVVAAFKQLLGRKVRIHPYNCLSGAIGAALIAREMYLKAPCETSFLGFEGCGDYRLTSFECQRCPNMCEVTKIERRGQVAFFGDVCERYTSGLADTKASEKHQDLCAEREDILHGCVARVELAGSSEAEPNVVERLLGRGPLQVFGSHGSGPRPEAIEPRGTIGIPRASLYFELFPLWASMFKRLGYDVVDSGPSTKELLAKGIRKLSAEACLPVKLAYSHALELVGRDLDYIFLPSIVDLSAPFGSPEICSTCPYTQALPFMVRSAVEARFLIPQINMSVEMDGIPEGLEVLAGELGVEKRRLRAAYQTGKETFLEFKEALLRRGDEILASELDWAAVLIGKPYNIYDPFLNLNLVRHLTKMGVTVIPYELVARVGSNRLDESWDSLPWRFNRDYIKVALTTCADTRLYPIVVSNFGCGPDAFTVKHLERILAGRPSLFLEFDEHRGEAGLVTRLEAFADEVAAHVAKGNARPAIKTMAADTASRPKECKFFIPNFADHAFAYAAALRYVGIDAEVLPPPDAEVKRRGEQFSSGKECHPYSIIAGDLVRLTESRAHADPPCVFLFPGTSIPCLMTQYGAGCRLILDQIGERDVQVVTPDSRDLYDLLGLQGGIRLWRGLTAMDMLVKASCELRPYEGEAGAVDAVHQANCLDLAKAVEGGDIVKTVKECIDRLSAVEMDEDAWRRRDRPVVGVAGDIYTRTNRFANQNLFATLEGLGCEVWPAPFIVDVFDFGLKMAFARSLYRRDVSEFFHKGWLLALKELSEQSIREPFLDRFKRAKEPGYREVVEVAAPYVGERASEVLMLNIAKMVDFATKGADGIINAMCFNCMVGSVSAALTLKLRRDHGNIPLVNLVLGGSEGTTQTLRLEAFIHQVKSYAKQRPR